MPIPKPRPSEKEEAYVSRCMVAIGGEYEDKDQALAVCYSTFKEGRKKMNEQLLEAIRQRQASLTEFGYGITTADRYAKNVLDAVGLEVAYKCAATRTISWDDVMKKAARTLVYSNPDMVTEEIEYSRRAGSSLKKLDDIELPKNCLMVFRHVLTTPRKDRDGDVLRTQGAKVDPKMILLWNHVHTLPIGKMLAVSDHNSKKLSLISCIVDMNDLSHDCAVMIDNGMGRFSHGFRAIEFTKIKSADGEKEAGFDVSDFEIMEESLVTVPSNTDAEVEELMLGLVEGGKMTSPIMKEYGKSIRSHRPLQVGGVDLTKIHLPIDLKITLNGKEIKDADVKGTGVETGAGGSGEGTDQAGLAKEADAKAAGKAEEAATDEEIVCPECGEMMPRSAGAECPKCGYVLKKPDMGEEEEEEMPEEEKSGRVFSGENFTTIKGVHGDVRELNKGQHVRDKSGIEMCKRCDKRLKAMIKEYDMPIGKSARSISAKNLAELKEVHGDLKDIDEGDHVITDKGRPIAHRAAKTLGGLVAKYDTPDEEGKSFEKGDTPGHPFRGNQYSGGSGGGGGGSEGGPSGPHHMSPDDLRSTRTSISVAKREARNSGPAEKKKTENAVNASERALNDRTRQSHEHAAKLNRDAADAHHAAGNYAARDAHSHLYSMHTGAARDLSKSIEHSMAEVIASATPSQRKMIRKAFDAIEEVERANLQAKQYRALVAR